jgi:hypothetical protein
VAFLTALSEGKLTRERIVPYERDRRLFEIEALLTSLSERIEVLEAASIFSSENRRIILDSTMESNEMQAEIDSLPRYIPYGITYTVRFTEGSYTLRDRLSFEGFFGMGTLVVEGNSDEAAAGTKRTTQSVTLNCTGNGGLYLASNALYRIGVSDFKVSGTSEDLIQIEFIAARITVAGCYLVGGNITNGSGIRVTDCNVSCNNNMLYENLYGIFARTTAIIGSSDNDSVVGNEPAYGLCANSGIIFKISNQPSGQTANERNLLGGQIW